MRSRIVRRQEQCVMECAGVSLPYLLSYSTRTRNLTLSVRRDGTVRVSAPLRASRSYIENLLVSKIAWIEKTQQRFSNLPQPVKLKGTRGEFLKYRDDARSIVHERLSYFNTHYQASFGVVRIKNLSSRWGSCSKHGNLNFHYKIALLPPHLQDYLVVHELCHIREFNHGARFWALVGETIPYHRTFRRELSAVKII